MRRVVVVIAVALVAAPASAHQPWTVGSLLASGDEALALSPPLSFEQALRTEPLRSPVRLLPHHEPMRPVTADVGDLVQALHERGVSPAETDRIAAAYRTARMAGTAAPREVPEEFSLYVAGAVAWSRNEIEAARTAWLSVLALPPAERRHRSTWARWMLARSHLDDDPAHAAAMFAHVRQLAAEGFADVLDLAGASHGEEARALLAAGQPAEAIAIYAAQFEAGDSTVSLQLAARHTFERGDALEACASNETARRVLLAWLAAHAATPNAERFLAAVERADVREAPLADLAAAAAYNSGRYDLAMRWLELAPRDGARANWYRGKLALRAGAIENAEALFARASEQLPRAWVPPRNDVDLWCGYAPAEQCVAPAQQLAAELSGVRVALRKYEQALDGFVRAGFWSDAAYVAEVVLTPDELKAYVDAHWPERGPVVRPEIDEKWNALAISTLWVTPDNVAGILRHLLARRLARLERFEEARPYYPERLREPLDRYAAALRAGRDENAPAAARARALWTAAQELHHHWMDLLGTESDPDWNESGGNFEPCPIWYVRGGSSDTVPEFWERPCERETFTLAKASADELTRAAAHRTLPWKRYHYRYVAAELAWQAASLMPEQSEQTAEVLRAAGTWHMARDPEYANRFYKALVTRCGRTSIGRRAIELRWFPQ